MHAAARDAGLVDRRSNRQVPLRAVRVHSVVDDAIATHTITQRFKNSTRSDVEVTYTFPIQDGAVVSDMTAVVGSRRLKGVVKKRQEARDAYDDAIAAGSGAFLVERDEKVPDVFTATLGNVPAGADVEIVLTVSVELAPEGDALRLTIPTTVAPRYVPWSAAHVRKPSMATLGAGDESPVFIDVHVRAPSAITGLTCTSHPEATIMTAGCAGRVTLGDPSAGLSGDFVVLIQHLQTRQARVWVSRPWSAEGTSPAASDRAPAVAEAGGDTGGGDAGASAEAADAATEAEAGGATAGTTGAAVMTTSPATTTTSPATAVSDAAPGLALMVTSYPQLDVSAFRNDSASEFIFVVDRSGSMGGSKMQGAIDTLTLCLRSITPGSWFNILGFGSHFAMLFPESRPYNQESLNDALRHVRSMDANMGGTELLKPLRAVFSLPTHPSRPKQVLVFTDGGVSNTSAVVDCVRLARERSADVRVFGFGIGCEASSALVSGIAEAGGGFAEFILPGESMEDKVARQMRRALRPVLHDVHVDWGALAPLIRFSAPKKPQVLFDGQRVTVFALLSERARDAAAVPARTTVRLVATGPDGDLAWPMEVDVHEALGLGLSAGRGASAEAGAGAEATAGAPETHVCDGNAVWTLAVRAVIADLEADEASAPGSEERRVLKESIESLSVRFGVSSKHTSFVAVVQRDTAAMAPMRTLGEAEAADATAAGDTTTAREKEGEGEEADIRVHIGQPQRSLREAKAPVYALGSAPVFPVHSYASSSSTMSSMGMSSGPSLSPSSSFSPGGGGGGADRGKWIPRFRRDSAGGGGGGGGYAAPEPAPSVSQFVPDSLPQADDEPFSGLSSFSIHDAIEDKVVSESWRGGGAGGGPGSARGRDRSPDDSSSGSDSLSSYTSVRALGSRAFASPPSMSASDSQSRPKLWTPRREMETGYVSRDGEFLGTRTYGSPRTPVSALPSPGPSIVDPRAARAVFDGHGRFSTPAAPFDPSDLMSLISLAGADGHVELWSDLARHFRIRADVLVEARPSELRDIPDRNNIWATALFIELLARRFRAARERWSSIATKSERWIHRQIPDALMAVVQAAAREFVARNSRG